MANIGAGTGNAGKRAVDHEIPLVPFIDLLLCCVMFLLVTAVWNQLGRVEATLPQRSVDAPVERSEEGLVLRVERSGYVLASPAGDRFEIAKHGNAHDNDALRDRLRAFKQLAPNRDGIAIVPDDGVVQAELVAAMDLAIGVGFYDVSLSGF